jgi:hypothetical protein
MRDLKFCNSVQPLVSKPLGSENISIHSDNLPRLAGVD